MNLFTKCYRSCKGTLKETFLLLRNIPSPVVAFFVVSVVTMNLLANKTILSLEYLALDGGLLVSWIAFLAMDIVTKHFGPRAATLLSIFALFVNLVVSLIFYLVSIIPGDASPFVAAFNQIFGGTWFILLSSSIAFIASAVINNFLNYAVGKTFKKNPDGKLAYFTRSYVSTFIGQFADNMIFTSLVFLLFFPVFQGWGWTFIQALMCSLFGAMVELLLEAVFSPIGYYVCKKWKKDNIGEQYFEYIRSAK